MSEAPLRLIFQDLGPEFSGHEGFGDSDLLNIPSPASMVTLSLELTEVTDEGLRIVGARFPNLAVLDIDGTKITDIGMTFLSELTKLRELWIEQTEVTDKGLLTLIHLKNLEFVSALDSGVTPQGAEEFSTHVPTCHVDVYVD